MITTKIVSSLEKIFPDERIEKYPTLERISALKGERVSVQLVYTYENMEGSPKLTYVRRAKPILSGKIAEIATFKNVRCVPVTYLVHAEGLDDNMERTTPGLFPDVIEPLRYEGSVNLVPSVIFNNWIEFDIPKDYEAGEYTFSVKIDFAGIVAEASVVIEVIDATLPDEDIYFTQWFHCDCIAQYYEVPVYSEKHWAAIENFARVAVRNGINMLLTPVLTPPLDTAVGGERLTTQLVGITKTADGYEYDYSLLDRWIEMCDRVGIKYFEISHLFTQWGAEHAPKVMATVDGEYRRIFGWETTATGEEYSTFLKSFVSSLLDHLKKNGNDKRCIFHISDEPGLQHLENYKAAKAIVADLLKDYKVMDALSKLDFYNTGVIKNPIPASNHVHKFIDAGVKDLWTYYCVSQWRDVSNRYHSMPACRNRSIGMQIYKYDIVGFLQWGYNFYNNQFSNSPIDPYLENGCDYAFPGGDSFSVYPGPEGQCYESCRLKVFFEALQDIKAMKLCEKLYSKEEVVAAIEDAFGGEIRFNACARSAEQMLRVRARINEMIKAKV
ncbi:MAG: DUF4091 domain-containing protein [Clostridia bacterium]|nr:DUF4091 domain-containing protein [Clostridia bacterium]